MDVAFCYESVLRARGGCETYIGDLARRLAADGHVVHLYACRWDAASLPATTIYHRLPVPGGPRFLRPWRFAASCAAALRGTRHDVSVGFDKTYGQDLLYPQGGLHSASAQHNLLKYKHPWMRSLAAAVKAMDPACWSFARLERRQYQGPERPLVVVNSKMVQAHFRELLGDDDTRLLYSAVNPDRFLADDRPRRRADVRDQWEIRADETVGLFVAMNYRLKGLAPLLHGIAAMPAVKRFRLVVAGNPRFARYERLARRLGVADRVRFIGYFADTRNAYFAADFLIHPTFYDPCSLVVLEALACGLPVVTSRYNGASELLTPPLDGLVVDDPHDAKALGQAVATFCDRDRLTAAARAARQAAACWTFDDHYKRLVVLFKEAAARKRAA